MVAAAGTVGVEVDAFDSLLREPLPGRRVLAERTGRRDMVGGDRVAEDQQRPRAAQVAGKLCWQFEERRAGGGGRGRAGGGDAAAWAEDLARRWPLVIDPGSGLIDRGVLFTTDPSQAAMVASVLLVGDSLAGLQRAV